MVNLLRKYQQPLMIAVTIVIIICFVWFYNGTQMDRIGSDRVATIYGRHISMAEFARGSRKFEVCRELRLVELLETMVGPARSIEEAKENFIFNGIILRHEAERLGVTTTDDDIVAGIQELPTFQTNGAYDSRKYTEFVQTVLTPNGFSPDQLEELMRDQLRMKRVRELIGSTVEPAPAEVRSAYEFRNQQTELSLVRLKLEDFLKTVQLTDEELQKAFDERKESLNTEEKRKVRVAAFVLQEAEKTLTGAERVKVMQKLADRAQEFAVAMTDKEAKFDEVAAKFEVKPVETPEFTASGAAPAELGSAPDLVKTAFSLSEKEPNSDALAAENGYYVLQLSGLTAPRPLTLEEAKPQLTEQLREERAQEAMNLKAAEIRNKIDAELKGGKSFADAVTAAGAQVETFPPFSLAVPKMDAPNAGEIMTQSLSLKPGQLSQFVPVQGGGVLLHVNRRLPIDEEQFSKEQKTLAESVGRAKEHAAFQEWLTERRAAANVQGARS
jgi:peptidyl-prolyl cis-trans isomerase D